MLKKYKKPIISDFLHGVSLFCYENHHKCCKSTSFKVNK